MKLLRKNLIKSTISSRGQLTIPKPVRDELDLNQQDVVVFEIGNNQVTLRKLDSIKVECPCSLKLKMCRACLNTGIVDLSQSFFDHIQYVQEELQQQIEVRFTAAEEWYVICLEDPLQPEEIGVMNKWVKKTIAAKGALGEG